MRKNFHLPLPNNAEGVTGGGGGAWTIGGAAGSSWGLLGKSSNVRPVTEALNRGFLMGVAPVRCCGFEKSLIILILFTRHNQFNNSYIFFVYEVLWGNTRIQKSVDSRKSLEVRLVYMWRNFRVSCTACCHGIRLKIYPKNLYTSAKIKENTTKLSNLWNRWMTYGLLWMIAWPWLPWRNGNTISRKIKYYREYPLYSEQKELIWPIVILQ